jgi:isocitrate lyase
METKVPDLNDARKFSEGVRKLYPHQMLAYNLSPSFNWDASGMSDNKIATFNDDLGRLGYVSRFSNSVDCTFDYPAHIISIGRFGSLLHWQDFTLMV